jgi:DNA-binding transcriptional ArsR family regulator
MPSTYVDADVRILRAAAHPTRSAIVYELYARGESTATEIAMAIDQPTNAVSFHLRQLAAYGLVEEAPSRGRDARKRWWRMVAKEGLRIDRDKVRAEPGGNAALRVRNRHALGWWTALLERYFAGDRPEDRLWRINDVPMLLTDDEAQEMADEVHAVLTKWARRGQRRRRATGPERRSTYLGLSVVMPHQPDLAQAPAAAESRPAR